MKRIIAAILLLATANLLAGGSPWGISSHPLWSTNPKDLEMEVKRCKEAGIKYFRTDLTVGEYLKNGFKRFDEVVAAMAAEEIKVLPTLSGFDWNVPAELRPLYKHLDFWRKFIREAGEHYKGKIDTYEIWNEQDLGFWKPHPDASQYVPMLKIAYEELKKIDPANQVMVGGLTGWKYNYLSDMYASKAQGYFDIVAVHPYGWGPDASPARAREMVKFKELMAKHGDADKKIWITECGSSTFRSSLLSQQPDVMIQALKFALRKIGKPDAEIAVGALVSFYDSETDFEPTRPWLPGVKLIPLNPQELAKTDPDRIPIVIGCEHLYVEQQYLEGLRSFVERGGIVLASGVVPFYVERSQQPNGNWINKEAPGKLHPFFRIGFDAHWTKKGLPQSTQNVATADGMNAEGIKNLRNIYVTRFLSPKNLKEGDTYTPIVNVCDKDGKPFGQAMALYTFGDWKGAILANTMLIDSGVSEQEMTSLLPRLYLSYLAAGVDKLFFYNLRNKGTNPAEREDNFGLVRRDFSPKPAWHAYKEMTAALGAEPEFVKRLETVPEVWALVFRRAEDGKQVVACWSTNADMEYELEGIGNFKGAKVYYKEL